MTRPAGRTARGLPYPGSADIHAETPAALQALAEAVTSQLGTLPGGTILDFYTGKVHTDNGAYFSITFPKLNQVMGCVMTYGTFLGGPVRAGFPYAYAPGGAGYGNTGGVMAAALGSVYPNYENFNNTDLTICAIAWGPPK